jgi:cell wall-active antibiotic response 4TMS protein YvqF
MRVNRRFLFWGVSLVAVGGVLVAADLGRINTAILADVIRLWPLAVVAIGASVVLRRTRISLSATLVAALIPGVVLGAAFAVAPRIAGSCGVRDDLANVSTEHGSFDGPAAISVRSGCGILHVTTVNGVDWTFDSASSGRLPDVRADDRSLEIDAAIGDLSQLDPGRNRWDLTLPTEIDDLRVTVVAGSAALELPGATINSLRIGADAAKVSVDATTALVSELDAIVNAGDLSLSLADDGDLVGSVRVNAGDVDICYPAELGLRVVTRGAMDHVVVRGDDQGGGVWISPNYRSAAHHADIDIRSNFWAVEFNPIGGCS